MFDFFKRARAPEDHSPDPKAAPSPPRSWHERLTAGLKESRAKFTDAVSMLFSRKRLDDESLEALETALLTADAGVAATTALLADLQSRVKTAGDTPDITQLLRESLFDLLKTLEAPNDPSSPSKPYVVMLAGVNGAGKTTSIGKLTRRWQNEHKTVLLAAGDTFRAAAG
ncbi:MAG: signal recognition particle receptor subunit alpha, partial [Burkholderiales bacterium]|nr:signal recognition particle receptor subunit alpha [Burkholderiales bacterium]